MESLSYWARVVLEDGSSTLRIGTAHSRMLAENKRFKYITVRHRFMSWELTIKVYQLLKKIGKERGMFSSHKTWSSWNSQTFLVGV